MMRPTRLTGPPFFVQREGSTRWIGMVPTDMGGFTYLELASVMGMSESTLKNRISRHGWQSEKVLAPIVTKYLQRQPDAARFEFAKLSNKRRDHNLVKMRLGTWEREQINKAIRREQG